uniref:Uncharacterized protein n=1 Tax=Anguilla anguilla TaxID=7936 RepID=A0A0E9TBA1_ANGAN
MVYQCLFNLLSTRTLLFNILISLTSEVVDYTVQST